MGGNTERILTTHAGSLPRPADLLELAEAGPERSEQYQQRLRQAVREAVDAQIRHGLDIVDDGEFSKNSFSGYINERLGGFEPDPAAGGLQPMRDHLLFPEYYADVRRRSPPPTIDVLGIMYPKVVCTGPITYTGHDLLKRDLDNLKAALEGQSYTDVFVPAISPENAQNNKSNAYYKTEEEFSLALAEALREEYKAIIDAGFQVQIDDPQFVTYYNRNPGVTVAECRKWAEGRIEILNHALRGLPQDRIRFHTCYSFDMAPRVGDMELKDILDIILKIDAGEFSFEGANPRHEHEWALWKTTKLPEGKRLIPGVVAISTVLVEHPDLVAERIVRYANVVGRENVIAGIDCGFGTYAGESDIHPTIAWAKIDSLVEGARRASSVLWGRSAA